MKVFVYRNLARKCWSIRSLDGPCKGRVVAHADALRLTNAQFRVGEAGRQRVLREKRKNVHAGVVGTLVRWYSKHPAQRMDDMVTAMLRELSPSEPATWSISAKYNPYTCGSFTVGDPPTWSGNPEPEEVTKMVVPIRGAGRVWFTESRGVWVTDMSLGLRADRVAA